MAATVTGMPRITPETPTVTTSPSTSHWESSAPFEDATREACSHGCPAKSPLATFAAASAEASAAAAIACLADSPI